jgi:hypothetical protein
VTDRPAASRKDDRSSYGTVRNRQIISTRQIGTMDLLAASLAGDRSSRYQGHLGTHRSSRAPTTPATYNLPPGSNIINQAALAHLGERQTEANFNHCETCSSLPHSGGTVFDPQKRQPSPSSVAQLVARSAVMTARSKQPEGFWFDPRLRSMRSLLLPLQALS